MHVFSLQCCVHCSYFLEAQDLLLEESGHLLTDNMWPPSPSNPHIRELGHFKTGKGEANLGIASMMRRTSGKGMGFGVGHVYLKAQPALLYECGRIPISIFHL